MLKLTVSEEVQIGVALATVLLAAATFYMAKKTRDMARSANLEAEQTRRMGESAERQAKAVSDQAVAAVQQAVASAELVQASIRPWVTAVPYSQRGSPNELPQLPGHISLSEDDRFIYLSVPLRNIGNGLALFVPSECYVRGRIEPRSDPVRLVSGRPSIAVLGLDEITRLRFRIAKTSGAWSQLSVDRFAGREGGIHGEFFVEVKYTDAAGRQPTWATVHVADASDRKNAWRVNRIEYRTDRLEAAPIAVAEFAP